MRLNKICRRWYALLATVVFWGLLCTSVYAATTVTVLDGAVSITDTIGNGTVTNGTVTVKAVGSTFSKATNTITITNNSGSTGTLTFDYSVSNANSCTIANKAITGNNTYSGVVAAGGTLTITLQSKSGLSNKTATLTLSNFNLVAAAANPNITITYGNLGSVKIDGTAVASGSVNSVSSASGASFVATPGSGNKFLAWIDPATNAVISTSATYQLIPTEDMAIKAVFTNASSVPMFFADGQAKLFESFDTAISHASSASNKTITLASDGTFPAGNYTIPAGVTLLIPYDAAHTMVTDETKGVESYTEPSAFRTLTMANGANITVTGTMCVAGRHSAKYGNNGLPTGPQGFVIMKDGSSITVDGTLYAWGYVVGELRKDNGGQCKGGTVTVNGTGTVYECFQVEDYRGGDATSTMAWSKKTFPMSQYYLQNVQVPMTLMAGATETALLSVTVTLAGIQTEPVPFMGQNGMFRITDGYVVKDYDENTDRLTVDIHGDVTMASMSISIKVSLIGDVEIDSSDYALPIVSNMTLNVHEGSNVLVDQDIVLLPGLEFNIAEGSNVTVGTSTNKRSVYLYDCDDWVNYCHQYKKFIPLTYAYDRAAVRTEPTTDAKVTVNGYVDATHGYLYTTTGNADICSNGTGQIKVGEIGSKTTLDEVYQDDTDITQVTEEIFPAKFHNKENANPQYTDTATHGAGTYAYIDGYWHLGEAHSWTTSEKCDFCPALAAAKTTVSEKTRYFATVQAAVNASTDKRIMMCSASTEAGFHLGEDITLDLFGCTLTLTSAMSGTGSIIDSATDDFTSEGGKIIGTVTAPAVAEYVLGNTSPNYYVMVDLGGGSYSFPRVATALTGIQYALRVDGTGFLAFENTFKGNANAAKAVKDTGFAINGVLTWYVEDGKGSLVNPENGTTVHHGIAYDNTGLTVQALLGVESYVNTEACRIPSLITTIPADIVNNLPTTGPET